jgi:AraC-like DNA-binding protein
MAKGLNPRPGSRMPPPVTIPIALVRGMLSGVDPCGPAYDAFLGDAGIARDLLAQDAARATAVQYIALYRFLIERLADEAIGLLSRPLKPGCFALIARAAMGAPELETAIRRCARTFSLVQDDVQVELVRDGQLAGVALRFGAPAVSRPLFVSEMLVRVAWRLLAWLAGGQLPVARFDFAFPPPAHVESYAKVFPAPLNFDQARSAFWFDARRLKGPVRRDEAALKCFLAEAQAYVIVPPVAKEPTVSRVRQFLRQARPAWPDLAATAAALHKSVSTLQRHLALEGTSFQALKDELRRDIAIVRLSTSPVPLAALAQELGFRDSAAFQRAFKTWTGSAPGAYRGGPSRPGGRGRA